MRKRELPVTVILCFPKEEVEKIPVFVSEFIPLPHEHTYPNLLVLLLFMMTTTMIFLLWRVRVTGRRQMGVL